MAGNVHNFIEHTYYTYNYSSCMLMPLSMHVNFVQYNYDLIVITYVVLHCTVPC